MGRQVKIITKYDSTQYKEEMLNIGQNEAILKSLDLEEEFRGKKIFAPVQPNRDSDKYIVYDIDIVTLDNISVKVGDSIYDLNNNQFIVLAIQWLEDFADKKHPFILCKDSSSEYVYIEASQVPCNFKSHRTVMPFTLFYGIATLYVNKSPRVIGCAVCAIIILLFALSSQTVFGAVWTVLCCLTMLAFIFKGKQIENNMKIISASKRFKNETVFKVKDEDIEKSLKFMTQLIRKCKEEKAKLREDQEDTFDIDALTDYTDDDDDDM